MTRKTNPIKTMLIVEREQLSFLLWGIVLGMSVTSMVLTKLL